MSTQTQQDDDLIILTDDTQADEFNFDFTISPETQEKEVISFEKTKDDAPVSQDDTFSFEFASAQEKPLEAVVKKEDIIDNQDFSFDILDTPEKNEVITEEKNDSSLQDLSFFDDTQDEDENLVELKPTETLETPKDSGEEKNISLPVSSPTPAGSVLDRNDILSEAIFKLEQRKEVIVDEKSQTSGHITELEEQIKKLQNQVKWLKEDMNKLENEEKWILSDIASIEKIRDFQTETQSKVKKASETKTK